MIYGQGSEGVNVLLFFVIVVAVFDVIGKFIWRLFMQLDNVKMMLQLQLYVNVIEKRLLYWFSVDRLYGFIGLI